MRSRVVVLVYIALFVGELSWSGITPLIPSYVAEYDLTDFEGGLVLSIASLGILVASLPASYVTQRVSPRTLTLTAMLVIALAGFAMAIAPGYWAIVATRLVFGIGFGFMWVSTAAWLANAAGPDSPRVLALTTSIVGLGATLSPGYAGWVADHFGLSAPFVGVGVVTALLFALLLTDRSGTGLNKDPSPPARDLVRAAHSDKDLVMMLLLTTAAAVVWMTADLLVPLRLDRHGYDIASIGVVFSLAAIVFVTASALTARKADTLTASQDRRRRHLRSGCQRARAGADRRGSRCPHLLVRGGGDHRDHCRVDLPVRPVQRGSRRSDGGSDECVGQHHLGAVGHGGSDSGWGVRRVGR